MKNFTKLIGIIAMVAVMALAVSCSKNEGNGGSAAGTIASATAAPATDFSYRLVSDDDREYPVQAGHMRNIGEPAHSQIPDGVVITGYSGNGGKVVIPATIEDIPVVMIGRSAFLGETQTEYRPAYEITEVVIPEGVALINRYAFNSCPNLTTVTLPASLKWIGSGALENCGELSTLNLPASPSFLLECRINNHNTVFSMEKLPLKTRAVLEELATKSIALEKQGE